MHTPLLYILLLTFIVVTILGIAIWLIYKHAKLNTEENYEESKEILAIYNQIIQREIESIDSRLSSIRATASASTTPSDRRRPTSGKFNGGIDEKE